MTLAGVTQEEAERALLEHETVDAALDALIQKPPVSGDKYIPGKPVVKTGVDPEQEERCRKGRWLQDQVNAVFSVAQTQTKTQTEQTPAEAEQVQVSVPTVLPPQGTTS
jgi:hypothetical protein